MSTISGVPLQKCENLFHVVVILASVHSCLLQQPKCSFKLSLNDQFAHIVQVRRMHKFLSNLVVQFSECSFLHTFHLSQHCVPCSSVYINLLCSHCFNNGNIIRNSPYSCPLFFLQLSPDQHYTIWLEP